MMFDSRISAEELILRLDEEADIARPIPKQSYIEWLNAAEQLLYSEIIHEQHKAEIDGNDIIDGVLDLSAVTVPDGADLLRFEDIYTVFCGDRQLIRTNRASGDIFRDVYFKADGALGINCDMIRIYGIRLIYYIRPKLKTIGSDGAANGNIMLPPEFVPLISAKLRGEAYKLANEDVLSAKWLNDYNILLENFKEWIKLKQASFSM